VYGKERNKNRKVKKKYVYERMKEKKRRKRKEDEWQERYERDESSETKKLSARKDVMLLRDETSTLFQPCAVRQRGRHRYLVVIFSFALAHVHHSISSYP
jgi:hypothetical protein